MTKLEKLVEYGVSLDEINSRFCEDLDLYFSCIDMLFDENEIAALEASIKSKDYKTAFKAAHSIKGIVGNLDFKPLYKLLTDLVEDLRADKVDDVDNKFELCKNEYLKIKELLEIK